VKVLETYVGRYAFKHNGLTETVNIILKDKKLYGYSDDEEAVELNPETANQFYGASRDIGGFKLQFVKDPKGNVAKFLLQFAPQLALMTVPFDRVK
jgi:hypothetical protein